MDAKLRAKLTKRLAELKAEAKELELYSDVALYERIVRRRRERARAMEQAAQKVPKKTVKRKKV